MKSLRKIAPLLLIVGLILIFVSASIAFIENAFNPLSIKISLVGMALFVLSLFFSNFKNYILSLNLLNTIPKIIYILLLIIFFSSWNVAAKKYNLRFDFTQAKQHTLTETTTGVLEKLKADVKFTAFYVGFPPKYIEDLFKEYERFSGGHIQSEIVDPLEQISLAAQFGNVIKGDEKKVFVQSSNERVSIDFSEKEPLGEDMLTNAILKVTRQKRNIYFLVGHGEYDILNEGPSGFSTFNKILTRNNCANQTLMLAKTKKIPSDCDILVIAGAKNPIPREEKDSIQDYLRQGGKALIFIESMPVATPDNPLTDIEKQKNPSLNEILNAWGLKIGDDIVVDLDNHVGQDVGCPATRSYPPHKEIIKNLDYTFFIRPRSISFIKDISKTIKVAPLVITTSAKNSWAETNKNLQVKFDPSEDTQGPIPIAAVVWEPKNEDKASDTRIIVFTDADFASNNYISEYSNADLAINSVAWLTLLDNLVKIEKKNIEVARLDLTSRQKRVIIVILISMPLLIAFLGGLAWWRRGLSN